MNNLPIFTYDVSDALFIDTLSFVEAPATETEQHLFSKLPENFSIITTDTGTPSRLISCVVRADYPILRQFPDGSLYNVVFPPKVCTYLLKELLANLDSIKYSSHHNPECPPPPLKLTGLFQSSEEVLTPGFPECALGSIFATFEILDPNYDFSNVGGISAELNYDSLVPLPQIQFEDFSSLLPLAVVPPSSKLDEVFGVLRSTAPEVPGYKFLNVFMNYAFFSVDSASGNGEYDVVIQFPELDTSSYQACRASILNGPYKVYCTCQDFKYRCQHALGYESLYPQPIPANITNPENTPWYCKHISSLYMYCLPLYSSHLAKLFMENKPL